MRARVIVFLRHQDNESQEIEERLWKQKVEVRSLDMRTTTGKEFLKRLRLDFPVLLVLDEEGEILWASEREASAEEIRQALIIRESHYDPRAGRGNFVPRIEQKKPEPHHEWPDMGTHGGC